MTSPSVKITHAVPEVNLDQATGPAPADVEKVIDPLEQIPMATLDAAIDWTRSMMAHEIYWRAGMNNMNPPIDVTGKLGGWMKDLDALEWLRTSRRHQQYTDQHGEEVPY